MRTRGPNRVSLILAAGTLFICVVWTLASRYVVPELIRSAYYGTSWLVLNSMITSQENQSLSTYLARWNAFAWDMLLALLVSGLSVTLVARADLRNAFWGPEPVLSGPGTEARATARGMPGDSVKLSRHERLANFAHSRHMALLFGAILPLAFLLRLLSLGAKSLSEDEIFSLGIAHAHLLGFWEVVTHSEANMVLYYMVLHFWNYFGQSELAIRSFSFIIALATIPALYWLGTRAFGQRVGILGALLLAINGFHIEYSQNARSYSLLVFLITLSSLFFLQSVREGSRRNWTRYIVTSTLAIYTHLFAVLVLVAHWASLLFLPRKGVPWRRIVPSTAAIAFLALPMGLFVLTRNRDQISWVPKTTVRDVYKLFACLAGQPDMFSPFGYDTALLLFVYSVPVIISIVALSRSRSSPKDYTETWYLTFFLAWLLLPILLTLVISVREPEFVDRYLIICLPAFILLASYGVSRLHRTWLVAAFLCVVGGLTADGLLPYYRSPGEDWKAAAQYVLSNAKPRDAAVFFPEYFQSRLRYYLLREPNGAGIPGPLPALLVPSSDSSFDSFLRNLPSQYDRVWFVTQDNKPVIAIETSLEAGFPGIAREKRFSGGLVAILYSK